MLPQRPRLDPEWTEHQRDIPAGAFMAA